MLERAVDRRWPLALGFVLLLLVLWQVAGWAGLLPEYVLPPLDIVSAMITGFGEGELGPALWASLKRAAVGFALGTGAGVLLGMLAGVSRPVEDVADSLVSLTYPLPKIALFPVFAVWLGFSDGARILIIALVTFYPAFVNALAATRGLDARLLWAARNMGASRVRSFFQVVVRGSLPLAFVGMRISLALSFVLVFAVEAYAVQTGLGSLIYSSYLGTNYGSMYAAIATLALAGIVADQILGAVSRRLLRGQNIQAVGRA